jgi:hypothetical protein
MSQELNELDKVRNEIESSTELLKMLAVVLRNAQPELVGKIRLVYVKTSKNDKYPSFIFNIREKNSAKLGKFQKAVPIDGIVKKLQRKPPFNECHEQAKKALQVIVKVIAYRENLIKKESDVVMSINNLLRKNIKTLAQNQTIAKHLDNLIYVNLESRDLEHYYHHTGL